VVGSFNWDEKGAGGGSSRIGIKGSPMIFYED
jgi:hypothetical protein